MTDYEMIMELGSFVWTMVPIVIHVLMVAAQCAIAGYLLVHGVALLVNPQHDSALLRRLGALRPEGTDARGFGFFQGAAGAVLLMPLALRAPWPAAAFACALALAALLFFGRRSSPVGRVSRAIAIAAAAFTLVFMLWERDDPLTLSSRILLKTNEWRAHELDWQLSNDVKSPKVGDLAPDFELQDPSGEKSVRLSSFLGKRPVALVFGSYT